MGSRLLFHIMLFLIFWIDCFVLECWYFSWLETPELELKNLLEIYTSLKANALIMEKVQDVNVSNFFCQCDIVRMQFRYGLDYETAEILYQYHQYHNVKIGSIKTLIEYTNVFSDLELKEYEARFSKKGSVDPFFPHQHKEIKTYLFVCGSCILVVFSIIIILRHS